MASTEAPISITVKTGAGSLVTVRAESGEELDQTVALSLDAIKSAVTELESTVGGKASTVTTAAAVSTLQNAFPGSTVVPADNAFANTPTLHVGRSCQHGKMTALQGPSKTGGVYKGYFCPSAQGDPTKCKTIYVNKTDPEWNTFIPDRSK